LHVVALQCLARDAKLMGLERTSLGWQMAAWVSIGLIVACVLALIFSMFSTP
jgi:uncharacterized membrane protein YukC